MTTNTETYPHRALHVRTVGKNSELNSVVKVQHGSYDKQYDTAKTKHCEHYSINPKHIIEISLTPVANSEADEMKSQGIPVLHSAEFLTWFQKYNTELK